MDKSERFTVLIFLIGCMLVFFALYLLLGGEETTFSVDSPTKEEQYIDDDLESENTPTYGRTKITRSDSSQSKRFSGSGGLSNSNDSSGSYSSESADTKRKDKVWPDWVMRHKRPSKGLSLDQRKAKLRQKLLQQGFKDKTYIDMKVLALEKDGFKSARYEAELLIEAGSIEAALDRLEREYLNTPSENLIIRSEILSLQMMIAMKHGFASQAETYVHKHMRLMRSINDIKKNTILANNPNAMAIMETQDSTLGSYEQYKDQIPSAFDWMKENKGLSPEALRTIRSGLVNQAYSNENISSKQVQSSYQNFEQFVKDGWANPK